MAAAAVNTDNMNDVFPVFIILLKSLDPGLVSIMDPPPVVAAAVHTDNLNDVVPEFLIFLKS